MACGLCKFEGGLLHKMLHSSEVEHYRENKTGYIINCKSYRTSNNYQDFVLPFMVSNPSSFGASKISERGFTEPKTRYYVL